MKHGLFIGKFYPPHVGHHGVISRAADNCEQVTVVVMASFAETIPLGERVEWLAAEHSDELNVRVVGVRCDAPVDVDDSRVWDVQMAAMKAAVRTITGDHIDVVYCAENYGQELAKRLGAQLSRVERPKASPSSSALRRDMAGAWTTLAPATRAGLTTRVVVVGAESSGTTTVSRHLAELYRGRSGVWSTTQWVAEFGREYTESKWTACREAAVNAGLPPPGIDELIWDAVDFDNVAAEQTRRENLAAQIGSPVLFCDTDAFATAVWERRYLGAAARTDQLWARSPHLPRHALYLVTDHRGVPWYDDGMREGDLAIRAAMTEWFIDALISAGHSWVLLSGTLKDRIELASRIIDPILEHRATFGTPLRGPGFEGRR